MTTRTKGTSSGCAATGKPAQNHMQAVASRAYGHQKSMSAQDRRIRQFLPMVPRIAQRVVSYLKPPLSFEDLVSAGTVGLVKAARDYDPSYQAEFKTYAYIRVKGAILDELRSWTFIPPNLNKKIQKTLEAGRKIANKTGTAPSETELAEAMDVPLEEVRETLLSARAQNFLSIDGPHEDKPSLGSILTTANTPLPEQQAQRSELVDQLEKAIKTLPERQRQIIVLYYQKNMTMKKIAQVFEITEPRVSQLHAGALFNLSIKLKEYEDDR